MKKNLKGMSLIEILIVVTVFAVIGTIGTSAVVLTLRGARKSESQLTVRENLNYAVSIIERQVRSAQAITECPNSDSHLLTYEDQDYQVTSFSCLSIGSGGYVASDSARLTSDAINVTNCSLTCMPNTNSPASVSVVLEAAASNSQGAEGAKVSVQTEITLRNR